VQVKRLGDGALEVVGGRAGGVELAEQGHGPAAHGVFDQRQLAHLQGSERVAQPGGFGVDAAAASGFLQQAAELGEGELGGVGGGRRGGQPVLRAIRVPERVQPRIQHLGQHLRLP
jgi:hypothetical protein